MLFFQYVWNRVNNVGYYERKVTYMSKVKLTKEEYAVFSNIAAEHPNVLIKFGGDMYRKGMTKGGIAGMIGAVAGALCTELIIPMLKERKNKKEIFKEEES